MRLTAPLILLLSVGFVGAAEPQPVMTTTGKTLVSEDFSGTALPKGWSARGAENGFSIVDGALQGVSKTGDSHDPFVIIKLDARDITVHFRAKFVESGMFLLSVDGHSDMFNGNTHLARLTIKPKEVSIQQELGSPESKQQQKEANAKVRKEGGKPQPPTPEQLKDPRYYHTEQLGSKRMDFGTGQWHDVMLEVNDRQMVAQIDGKVVLIADSVAVDAMKSRIVFEIGGRATVQFDDVRVSENSRRSDWEQVKQKIAATTAPSR